MESRNYIFDQIYKMDRRSETEVTKHLLMTIIQNIFKILWDKALFLGLF